MINYLLNTEVNKNWVFNFLRYWFNILKSRATSINVNNKPTFYFEIIADKTVQPLFSCKELNKYYAVRSKNEAKFGIVIQVFKGGKEFFTGRRGS